MSFTLNKKLVDLEPYDPGSGDYPIRLDANESYILMPQDIRERIGDAAASTAFNRYPDPAAAGLCAAFAGCYGIDKQYVTAANGSDELLYIISTCFTSSGDAVVTTAPDFSMYRFYSYLAECRNVVYNKPELEISPDGLIEICKENDAKLLVFSNPCNPTGRGLCRDDVRKIIKNAGCLVVLDEAYMDFWDESLISEAKDYPNLILLKTMSKAIGSAALRLGFAVANDTLTKALKSAKSPYNVNSVSQAAGRIILENKEYLADCRSEIVQRKNELYSAFLPICKQKGWKMNESFTNFLYIETDDAPEVYEYLKTKGILVRCFGSALRITAGSKAENNALIKALSDL